MPPTVDAAPARGRAANHSAVSKRSEPTLVRPDAGALDDFGADLDGPHHWIQTIDIAAERMSLISKVVIPFAERHLPSSDLFVALKDLEAAALAAGKGVPDFDQILQRLDAVESGFWQPDSHGETASSGRIQQRLVLPDPLFRIILALALNSPELLFDLRARYDKREMMQVLRELERLVPVYLVCTYLSYPLGGGESFMHQTCKIMHEFGFSCVWVSFIGANLQSHPETSITQTPYYLDVREAGGMTREQIHAAIRRWSPDVIHSQATANEFVAEAASLFRVPALIGYHFWNGLVELGRTQNWQIIRNATLHRLARTPDAMTSKLVTRYVASEFMKDVCGELGGDAPSEVCHPVSDPGHYETGSAELGDRVLQINIAKGKGGRILLECIRKLGDSIPFLAVRTEPLSERLDQEIEDAIADSPGSDYVGYGAVKDYYAQARLVMVPALVDETFCRVAYEAAMNGIPVLSTRSGFLPYLLGDAGIFLSEDPKDWIRTIEDLYPDRDRLRQIGQAQRTYVQNRFGNIPEAFIKAALKARDTSPKRNIGFFTAWAEQGLGYQTRHYAKMLRQAGYRAHVFSFQPYSAAGKALTVQHATDDWRAPQHANSVYYSFNDREHVTNNELEQFIKVNNIGTLVCPEVCWAPNWARLNALSLGNLAICSVPNIETVRRDEASLHGSLYATWYNTKIAERIFSRLGVRNGRYIGHGFGRALKPDFMAAKLQRLRSRDHVAFLHVGGHNPVLRKQTPLVIEAFMQALQYRKNIKLTVAVMQGSIDLRRRALPPNITLINETLSHDAVLKLYEQSDVSIQVSSHEGIGLGFYESISRGTPVISLNVAPHNEVVLDGETGWLMDARPQSLVDNNNSLISGAKFDVRDLAALVTGLTRDEIERRIESTCSVFSSRFDEVAFQVRLLSAMPVNVLAPWLAGSHEMPSRCLLCEQGVLWGLARKVMRAAWPNAKPSWARSAAPTIRRIDLFLTRIGIFFVRPRCCSEAARYGHPCIGRIALMASDWSGTDETRSELT